ncbi:TIGR00282 family metallophosphoesterase [bacterium]|nr:TIGR00282 family metallophosphoesterase [bacterium]
MSEILNVLCIGDLVGSPGRQTVRDLLPKLKNTHEIDFTIANVENVAGGFGVTVAIYDELVRSGVDVCTSGNHIYSKREILEQMDRMPRLLRPINFPGDHPGRGVILVDVVGCKVAVINAIGRVFMNPADCPFSVVEDEVRRIQSTTRVIFLDFHAEATSEKQAMGWSLAGEVSAVVGTHTHVPTADTVILDSATAYVTDLGMTGSRRSILGMDIDAGIRRLRTQLPTMFTPAKSVEKVLNAVKIRVDKQTGKALDITRIDMVTS